MPIHRIDRLFLAFASLVFTLISALPAFGQEPVSFWHDVKPILSRSCAGCHRPDKLKGKLDLTTFAALTHGGKTGKAIIPGDSEKSLLIQQISGDEPEMPDKGEKLSSTEVDILARWVHEGAKDDSPADAATAFDPDKPLYPKTYAIAPVISAMALSPDGMMLAIAGRNEILLYRSDGSGLIARLPSASPHINSICFFKGGAKIVSAGGSAGEFGRIEIHSVAEPKLLKSFPVSDDTLFGLSVSPSADRAAVGCADRTTRLISLEDGKELDRFTPHTDWVLATAFNETGDRVIAAGRDKSVWLLDLPNHRPFDLVNYPEDPIVSIARRPNSQDLLTGSASGSVKLYKLHDLVKTTEANRDPNRIKEFEGQHGPVNAITYSLDGQRVAIASTGEIRIYTADGNRRFCTCANIPGPVFAIAFSPDAKQIFGAGFDGKVRMFGTEKGELVKEFSPWPVKGEGR